MIADEKMKTNNMGYSEHQTPISRVMPAYRANYYEELQKDMARIISEMRK